MKRFLHILAAILSVCLALGALDLTGVIELFPKGVAQILTIGPPCFLAVGHAILAIGDQLDDGQKNNSFPGSVKCHPLVMAAAAALACLSMVSCVTSSTVTTTTAPDGTVTRTESKTSAPDAASVNAAASAATMAAVFARPQVIPEK